MREYPVPVQGEIVIGETKFEGDRVFDPLFQLCYETRDTEKAFLMSVVCRDVVSSLAATYETKTLGLVSSSDAGERWSKLMRQLRIVLLVNHRLKLRGDNRETVANVDLGTSSVSFDILALFLFLGQFIYS